MDTLIKKIKAQSGFLLDDDVRKLALRGPEHQVLIRCGAGRVVTAASTALHYRDIINAEGRDYVRDISLLAGDPIMG